MAVAFLGVKARKIKFNNTSWVYRFRKLKSIGRKRGVDETNLKHSLLPLLINNLKVDTFFIRLQF